jgi:dihydrofolate synthase/folylpolyglutamate synthase
MFSRMGSAAFKKDLTNIRILCERLGNPQEKFKSIHVGGTNGKGSVSHSLAAIFQTAGYKIGLYTSPHLYDFRERIKVNGAMAEETFVVSFVEKIKPLIEEIQPSFFEITVAMAFEYFVEQKVDLAIIEVGLGGRLDSTNIIQPELSIITNIGWDHTNMLGNTLEAIAFEKAGIIKEGIPVVVGERKAETEDVFINRAQEKKAPLYFASERFEVRGSQLSPDELKLEIVDRHLNQTTVYELDLPGIYQRKNILATLQAIELLKHWNIDKETVRAALKKVKKLTGLQGRWEVIHREPTVVLEVAHNQDGMEQLLQHLGQIHFEKLHLIMGMVKDKDIDQVLALLPVDAAYYFTQSHIPRALEASALKEVASKYKLHGETYEEVNTALQKALMAAGKNDLVIVCGSIFLVAEVDRGLIVEQS